jgi:DNA-binding protein HU-beta
MNRAELVAAVASNAGLTKKDADKALSAVVDAITASLKEGEKVSLVGFGTFEVSGRKERMGKNPRTGAPVSIPASKVPAFKAGKALKDEIK